MARTTVGRSTDRALLTSRPPSGKGAIPAGRYNALVRAALAGKEALDRELWEDRLSAAGSSRTLPRLLELLARDPDHDVRRRVARNPAASAEALAALAGDWSARTRRAVAFHPNVSPATLAAMAASKRRVDRALAAQNPRLPPRAATRLARDGAMWTWVASNPALPAREAARLAKDRGTWPWLASNPSLPADDLARIARDRRVSVRRSLAGNPAAPAGLQEELAGEGDDVRMALAMNPGTLPALLARLIRDPDPDVRRYAAEHPALPQAAVDELAASDDPSDRWLAVRNPNATGPTLATLAMDPLSWETRVRTVDHPNLPASALAVLMRDPDPKIRKFAAQALRKRRGRRALNDA